MSIKNKCKICGKKLIYNLKFNDNVNSFLKTDEGRYKVICYNIFNPNETLYWVRDTEGYAYLILYNEKIILNELDTNHKFCLLEK